MAPSSFQAGIVRVLLCSFQRSLGMYGINIGERSLCAFVSNGMLRHMLLIVSGDLMCRFLSNPISRPGGARVVLAFLSCTHRIEYRLRIASLRG